MEYSIENYEKSSKIKTTTSTSTHKEYYTPQKSPNFTIILPNVSEFLIYFPSKNNDQENNDLEDEDNSKKNKNKEEFYKKNI